MGHQPDLSLVWGHQHAPLGVGQDTTIEPHLPAVGNEQSGSHLQDRRFTGRIGANHRQPTTFGHVKGYFDVPGINTEVNGQSAHG